VSVPVSLSVSVSVSVVESRSAHDQNTSWVIVGYHRGNFYSNKEFSQLLNFLDMKGSSLVPERFRNESCSVRNKDQETMGEIEQDNGDGE
jgi:hypothetical protein